MEKSLFEILLKQFEEINYIPRVAVLYHGGEPLLNPNIFEFILKLHEISRKNCRVKIVTNASMLTQKVAKKLIDVELDILEVSFDGVNALENNYIRKNADFERDSGNLLYLLEQKSNISISVCNVQIIPAKKESDFNYIEPNIPEYLKNRFFKYLDQIEFKAYWAMKWPGYHSDKYKFKSFDNIERKSVCANLLETINILSNGDLVPCCYDIVGRKILGNIKEQPFYEIYKNTEHKKLIEDIKYKRINGLCDECLATNPIYLVKTN